mmetsp:Transcript_78963/g.199322  ORF Transcript_78963/g.199322 Transcript_78963/m.199322 type:complete len:360 (+) Transcript_78963:132-1211(+)
MAKVLMMGNKPGRENWVKDTSASTCQGCKAPFSLFKRRHHCRACGNVFCRDCTDFEIMLHRSHYDEGVEKQKRVCAWCYKTLVGQREDLARKGHTSRLTSPLPQGRERMVTEEEVIGMLSSLRSRRDSSESSYSGSDEGPCLTPRLAGPTLLAPPQVVTKPSKNSHFDDIARPELMSSICTPPSMASPFEEVVQPAPTLPQVLVTPPALTAAPAAMTPSFPALSPDVALPFEESRATSMTPRCKEVVSRVTNLGPMLGDPSEFCGPEWEAFSEAYPAAAAAFRSCEEVLSDPKAWDNQVELTIKALRLHVLRVPREDLHAAPGKNNVLQFVDHLEARRPLYRRQTAEIRERFSRNTRVC